MQVHTPGTLGMPHSHVTYTCTIIGSRGAVGGEPLGTCIMGDTAYGKNTDISAEIGLPAPQRRPHSGGRRASLNPLNEPARRNSGLRRGSASRQRRSLEDQEVVPFSQLEVVGTRAARTSSRRNSLSVGNRPPIELGVEPVPPKRPVSGRRSSQNGGPASSRVPVSTTKTEKESKEGLRAVSAGRMRAPTTADTVASDVDSKDNGSVLIGANTVGGVLSEETARSLIPLSWIPDKWHLAADRIDTIDEDAGIFFAAHATLVALKNLWYMEDPEWCELRHHVQVGLVKETKDAGNTSVSMGVAAQRMQDSPALKYVALLNCGTGGVKYQLYGLSAAGHLVVKKEYKPKGGWDSFSRLEVGEYDPSKVTSEWFGTAHLERTVKKNLAKAKSEWGGIVGADHVEIYAFITGTIRNYYYRADVEERKVLDSEVGGILGDAGVKPWDGSSFFMSQDREGQMEMEAIKTMYSNLTINKRLPFGTTPIISVGIGRGTCQWACTADPPTEPASVIKHAHGMSTLEGLLEFSNTIIKAYSEKHAIDNLVRTIKRLVSNQQTPVIALKSGCLLILKKDPTFLTHLSKDPTVNKGGDDKLIRIRVAQSGPPLVKEQERSFPVHTSFSRLCAEAAMVTKLTVDYVKAYLEDGTLVRSLEELQDNALVFFSGGPWGAKAATGPVKFDSGQPLLFIDDQYCYGVVSSCSLRGKQLKYMLKVTRGVDIDLSIEPPDVILEKTPFVEMYQPTTALRNDLIRDVPDSLRRASFKKIRVYGRESSSRDNISWLNRALALQSIKNSESEGQTPPDSKVVEEKGPKVRGLHAKLHAERGLPGGDYFLWDDSASLSANYRVKRAEVFPSFVSRSCSLICHHHCTTKYGPDLRTKKKNFVRGLH